MRALLIYILISLVSNANAAIGWIKAVPVDTVENHRSHVRLHMNGTMVGEFSHASSAQINRVPTWEIKKEHLSIGQRNTPITIDYTGLSRDCQFDFILYFRSGDSSEYISLGQFHAPSGNNAAISLGLCNGSVCSSDANIESRLKKERNAKKRKETNDRRRQRIQALRDADDGRASRPDELQDEYKKQQQENDFDYAIAVLAGREGSIENYDGSFVGAQPGQGMTIDEMLNSYLTPSNLSESVIMAQWEMAKLRADNWNAWALPRGFAGVTVENEMRTLLMFEGLHHLSSDTLNHSNFTILPVLEMAARLAPGLGLAIDATEAATGAYAIGPNKGKPMSTVDRAVAVIGVVTAGYGSKARFAVESAEAAMRGMSAFERAEARDFIGAVERVGVKTKAGAKTFASMYHALDTAPEAYKDIRIIREGGEASKIAVIGRGMGEAEGVGVNGFSKYMETRGIEVETVVISESSQIEFKRTIEKCRETVGNSKAILPASEVVETEMYNENLKWVEKLVNNRYTVVDIGNPTADPVASAFYGMEKLRLGGGTP